MHEHLTKIAAEYEALAFRIYSLEQVCSLYERHFQCSLRRWSDKIGIITQLHVTPDEIDDFLKELRQHNLTSGTFVPHGERVDACHVIGNIYAEYQLDTWRDAYNLKLYAWSEVDVDALKGIKEEFVPPSPNVQDKR